MKKKIEDYLHLFPKVYVQSKNDASKVKSYGDVKTAFVTGLYLNPAGAGLMAQLCCTDSNNNQWEEPLDVMVEEISPILFPLSEMTEEEANELTKQWSGYFRTTENDFTADAHQTMWLLSKHFDLFGLIEAGLAKDKTTLPK